MQTNPIHRKAINAYTDDNKYFNQIKLACDFINSKDDVFRGKYGPAVNLLVDYIKELENKVEEQETKLNKIKEFINEI